MPSLSMMDVGRAKLLLVNLAWKALAGSGLGGRRGGAAPPGGSEGGSAAGGLPIIFASLQLLFVSLSLFFTFRFTSKSFSVILPSSSPLSHATRRSTSALPRSHARVSPHCHSAKSAKSVKSVTPFQRHKILSSPHAL